MNPFWLGSGKTTFLLPEKYIDSIAHPPADPNELFSSFFDRVLAPRLEQLEREPSKIFPQLQKLPQPLQEATEAFRKRNAELQAKLEILMVQDSNSKELLDIQTPLSDNADVQIKIRTLGDLVKHLRKLTKPRGAKAALARDFGVSRQAVNQWLSGESSPSADIAIRLIYWKPNQPAK